MKAIFHLPLVPIVLALVFSYLISTILSVTPFTSLWGSYQRLQGTYTTFSYLVIFFSMIANLRRRAQVERVFWVVILSSLPVSLYGILQRYGADPIPWGGDVSGRIAANMGNAIFVAAYLIMVFPSDRHACAGSRSKRCSTTAAVCGPTSPAPPLMFLSWLCS